jgi:Uma2 family endonuclease
MPTAATTEQPGLSWETLCTDPRYAFLSDLPFKIETNEWGQIVMSPTYQRHGRLQFLIARLIEDLIPDDGESMVECAVETTRGVKEADAAWFSAARRAQTREDYAASIAPELCVEVLSKFDAWGEVEEKVGLYLEAGAEEVWICDLDGRMHFFDAEGERKRSARVPDFPARVEA